MLEDAQLIFLIFRTFVCKFGWVDKHLDAVRKEKNLQTNVWKNKKTSNLVNAIFYLVFNVLVHKLLKIQFWKKLLAIGFPYKHCNF